MLKRRNVKIIISFLLFLLGCKHIYYSELEYKNTKAMNNFFSYHSSHKSHYIAILEIPNISLKEGLMAKNSKKNTIKEHIQILEESTMPDKENSILFLAAHSGNSSISFFNDLEELNIDDIIYFYYKEKKYVYKITNCYYEKKMGFITLVKESNILVLTTCSQVVKGYQFIVIANLIDVENLNT